MSIENEIANAAKEYGYNFIKDSVDADEVIRTFNDEGKVYVPETYNSADDVDIIYQPVFDIQATDIVYDFENYNFSPVGVVSFSTDYRKIMIPVGPVNIKTDTPCSYSLKFKNRYFGV